MWYKEEILAIISKLLTPDVTFKIRTDIGLLKMVRSRLRENRRWEFPTDIIPAIYPKQVFPLTDYINLVETYIEGMLPDDCSAPKCFRIYDRKIEVDEGAIDDIVSQAKKYYYLKFVQGRFIIC